MRGTTGGTTGDNGASRAPENPRGSALADLYRHASALAAAGDLDAARAMHEAAGRVLGLPGNGAAVIDLTGERARRGER